MFHLGDFTDRVRQLDHLRVGVPSGKHEVHLRRLLFDNLQDLVQVDQFQVEGVVDLIQDEDIRWVRLYFFVDDLNGFLGIFPVFLVRIRMPGR